MGINTGLSISDLLKLRVSDIRNVTHIVIREEKTNQSKRFLINSAIKEPLEQYINNMKDDEHLFHSREGNNKPISRIQAHRVINTAVKNT